MRTARLLFMVIGIFFTSVLYAQGAKDKQNQYTVFEGVKVGSRNYSRTKTGFFAPSGISLGIGFDHETLRFSYRDLSSKPLNGGKLNCVIYAPLRRKSILSIENTVGFLFNAAKDTQLNNYYYKELKRWEGDWYWGLLLSTGYAFKRVHVIAGGGALLNFCMDNTALKTYSGEKWEYGNIGYENEWTKLFDLPITFAATVRYNRIGARVNYDIGTINRYNKKYYKETGTSKENTRKNNHFSVCIQYYF